jgi:hypothetical protein
MGSDDADVEGSGNANGANGLLSPSAERAPIPSALQQTGETNTTPLPILSMIVLSIVRAYTVYY